MRQHLEKDEVQYEALSRELQVERLEEQGRLQQEVRWGHAEKVSVDYQKAKVRREGMRQHLDNKQMQYEGMSQARALRVERLEELGRLQQEMWWGQAEADQEDYQTPEARREGMRRPLEINLMQQADMLHPQVEEVAVPEGVFRRPES